MAARGVPSVAAAIDFDACQLAANLLAALQAPGSELPAPPLVPLGAFEHMQQGAGPHAAGAGQAQLAAVLGALPPQQAEQAEQQLAAAGQQQGRLEGPPPGRPKPRLRLRERQELAALRRQMADFAPAPVLPDGGGGAAGSRGGGGLTSSGEPAFRGLHAPQARLLTAWVAEFLAVQYRNKRELLKAWYRSPANTAGGACAAAADGLVAVCERDALTARLDALWMDFLEVGRPPAPVTSCWLACLSVSLPQPV